MELEFDITGSTTRPCRIKQGWEHAGKRGQYFGRVAVGSMFWAIVLWDGDEDPDMCKSDCLEIAQEKFVSLSEL